MAQGLNEKLVKSIISFKKNAIKKNKNINKLKNQWLNDFISLKNIPVENISAEKSKHLKVLCNYFISILNPIVIPEVVYNDKYFSVYEYYIYYQRYKKICYNLHSIKHKAIKEELEIAKLIIDNFYNKDYKKENDRYTIYPK
ncbi:MAG: hypothetical protein ACOCRK_02670 [bacterium]